MRSRILFSAIAFFALIHGSSTAQSKSDEAAVRAVVDQLFRGMQLGDSTLVRTSFTKEVSLATAFRDKNSTPLIRYETSLDDFLKAVGTPHKETWYEEIWNVKIQIDDDIAQVWCDYGFYTDKNFSHCGIDAFHLHKGADGWKIFHLADTRRKEGCKIPADIQKKHQ